MTYRVICDVCGWKLWNYELKQRWDGQMVCEKDWEPRHPMDFLKSVKEDQKLPWARPQIPDEYVDVDYTYTPDPPPDGTFDYTPPVYEVSLGETITLSDQSKNI